MSYSESDSAPVVIAGVTPTGINDWAGTCQAGVCLMTPQKAFCCFTDSPKTPYDEYDTEIASASPAAKRHHRGHGAGKKQRKFHCWN